MAAVVGGDRGHRPGGVSCQHADQRVDVGALDGVGVLLGEGTGALFAEAVERLPLGGFGALGRVRRRGRVAGRCSPMPRSAELACDLGCREAEDFAQQSTARCSGGRCCSAMTKASSTLSRCSNFASGRRKSRATGRGTARATGCRWTAGPDQRPDPPPGRNRPAVHGASGAWPDPARCGSRWSTATPHRAAFGEAGQPLPRPEHRVLQSVVGVVDRAEHAVAVRPQLGPVRRDELVERAGVAVPGAADEGRSCRGTHLAILTPQHGQIQEGVAHFGVVQAPRVRRVGVEDLVALAQEAAGAGQFGAAALVAEDARFRPGSCTPTAGPTSRPSPGSRS